MAKVAQNPSDPEDKSRKWLRRVLQIVGGVIVLLVALIVTLFTVGRGRLNDAPAVKGNPVPVSTDVDAVVRGEKLANISGCTACHGSNLEG